MYFRMACRDEPFRSFKEVMAATIISIYLGCSAGLAGFLAAGFGVPDIFKIVLNYFSIFSAIASPVLVSSLI